jgi:hypothetical protein
MTQCFAVCLRNMINYFFTSYHCLEADKCYGTESYSVQEGEGGGGGRGSKNNENSGEGTESVEK